MIGGCVAADPTRRKCHNDEAGYLLQRNHPTVPGAHVIVYDAAEQSLDTDGGRYAIVCEPHGSILNTTSRLRANTAAHDPAGFCEECRS